MWVYEGKNVKKTEKFEKLKKVLTLKPCINLNSLL